MVRPVVLEVAIFQQSRGHLVRWQDVIDEPSDRGALGHAELGAMIERGFAERQAASLLDRLDPDRPVAPEPRQDDSDGVFTLVFGQRHQKGIDR